MVRFSASLFRSVQARKRLLSFSGTEQLELRSLLSALAVVAQSGPLADPQDGVTDCLEESNPPEPGEVASPLGQVDAVDAILSIPLPDQNDDSGEAWDDTSSDTGEDDSWTDDPGTGVPDDESGGTEDDAGDGVVIDGNDATETADEGASFADGGDGTGNPGMDSGDTGDSGSQETTDGPDVTLDDGSSDGSEDPGIFFPQLYLYALPPGDFSGGPNDLDLPAEADGSGVPLTDDGNDLTGGPRGAFPWKTAHEEIAAMDGREPFSRSAGTDAEVNAVFPLFYSMSAGMSLQQIGGPGSTASGEGSGAGLEFGNWVLMQLQKKDDDDGTIFGDG